jgi:SNF2 family DNA or RNA helicase
MRIEQQRGFLIITGKITTDTFTILKEVPSSWRKWEGRVLKCRPDPSAIVYLDKNFPDAEWVGKDVNALLNDAKRNASLAELVATSKRSLLEDDGKYEYKTVPRDHQRQAFLLSRDSEYFALLMEMGTGKTKVGLDTACYLHRNRKIDVLLIIAPPGVNRQWITEQIPDHYPEDVDTLIWRPTHPKYYQKQMDAILEPSSRLRVLSMNVEAIRTRKGYEFSDRFLRTNGVGGMMILDESTIIKNDTAAQSIAARKLGLLCKYRRIMSGAPVTRGMEDMFGQLNFLSSSILGLRTMTAFKHTYCYLEPIPGAPKYATKITGYRNIDEFQRKIAGYSFRVLKSDCTDLPEKTYMRVEVPLDKAQLAAYDQMRDEMLAELEDGTRITASIKIANLIKLSQIACGIIRDEEGIPHLISTTRHKRAIDLVEQNSGQIVLWARFKPDFVALAAELTKRGITFVEYHGGVRSGDREVNKQAFLSGSHRVFLGQPQSGGRGLNLQCADTSIYFSNSYDADQRWQSEDRIHRDGQQSDKCLYLDIIAPGTVDSKILDSLAVKQDIADAVNGTGYREFLI